MARDTESKQITVQKSCRTWLNGLCNVFCRSLARSPVSAGSLENSEDSEKETLGLLVRIAYRPRSAGVPINSYREECLELEGYEKAGFLLHSSSRHIAFKRSFLIKASQPVSLGKKEGTELYLSSLRSL